MPTVPLSDVDLEICVAVQLGQTDLAMTHQNTCFEHATSDLTLTLYDHQDYNDQNYFVSENGSCFDVSNKQRPQLKKRYYQKI